MRFLTRAWNPLTRIPTLFCFYKIEEKKSARKFCLRTSVRVFFFFCFYIRAYMYFESSCNFFSWLLFWFKKILNIYIFKYAANARSFRRIVEESSIRYYSLVVFILKKFYMCGYIFLNTYTSSKCQIISAYRRTDDNLFVIHIISKKRFLNLCTKKI